MRVGDLVKVYNDPLEGPKFRIPPEHLCAIREITGTIVIVQTPTGQTLTFNIIDVATVDS
jgi:hypothetical protein